MNESIQTDTLDSPSLVAKAAGATAYEVKFLIDEQQALQLEDWAKQWLQPDPHGDPRRDGGYLTTSLYTDTTGLDVYHRTPKYRRRKYRLRRYGEESALHLERKVRRGERVTKKRDVIPQEDLLLLSHALVIPDWPGHWFHKSLLNKELFPACLMTYERTAFQGISADGPVRMTFDRNIRGELCSEWTLQATTQSIPLLTAQVVMELKFQDAMPGIFKELVTQKQLCPTGFSKYRRCLDTWKERTHSVNPEVRYA